jgi:hypothetical protein
MTPAELSAALVRVFDLLERIEDHTLDADNRLLLRTAKRQLRAVLRALGAKR